MEKLTESPDRARGFVEEPPTSAATLVPSPITDIMYRCRANGPWGTIVAHSKLSVIHERLAGDLASGKTVKEAAVAAGLAERTVYRRLAERGFKARVDQLRAEMVERTAGRLVTGMIHA